MTWLLVLIIFVPLVAALIVAFDDSKRAFTSAMVGTMLPVVGAIVLLMGFDWGHAGSFQLAGSMPWLPSLGLELSVGVDGVSMLLIALAVMLGPVCVLASRSAITENRRSYYAWLLVLQAALVGVFAARDLVLFYICFEFTLLPMFVLIAVFGSTNRKAASIKFFLYTFTGSMIALAGLLYTVVFVSGIRPEGWTLNIGELTAYAAMMSPSQQGWVLLALLSGFAVKVPLFPFHTWLPLAHTEAPTAGSVILAAVLLKLGTYGIYRFAIPLAPVAFVEYAPWIAGLAIVGIIYAGLICWVQHDVKKLIAYSSVSHLGFCVLGLVALNASGLSGSVLYMLSHGLSTGGLFLMIGMMYERYHTRDMREVSGLAGKMPIWASFMVFFVLASVGLPGLNGFPSEMLCLLGTFQADASWTAAGEPGAAGFTLGPWYAVMAGTGMVIAAIYLLYMVGRICFGELIEPDNHGHDDANALPADLNAREIVTLLPMAAGCLFFGLFPTVLLDAIDEPVNNTIRLVEAAVGGAAEHVSLETNSTSLIADSSAEEAGP